MPQIRAGVVSVVLVNFRGADDTIEAIRHLGQLDWPNERLEIVVVENASGDDSASRIAEAAPHVTLVVSSSNSGFAGGCNQGVAASTGEFVALLNNDARPDDGWVRAAVERFDESPVIGAVASRVLDWDGAFVDYTGSAMTWYGMGYKPLTAEPVPKAVDAAKDVLFGTGSAMFVRRSVFDALEGFDERFFMFFEDVDFGWRLNLLGWRFVYEPRSLAFHKHHASMAAFGHYKEAYLLERNALFTLYKNIGGDAIGQALPAAMALSIRRGVARAGLDSTSFDLRIPGGDADSDVTVSKQAVSVLFGIDQFVEQLPGLRSSRDAIQATRTVSDARIWRLFGLVDAPVWDDPGYVEGYENIVTAFDVTRPPSETRVLIVTGDPIGIKLAGPAIRAWNMADQLARAQHNVTLLSLTSAEVSNPLFDIGYVASWDERTFRRYEKWADVIVFQGNAMAAFKSLRSSSKVIIADIYDPMHLEQLEQGRGLPRVQWEKQVTDATDILNQQLQRADFFMTASERQKHFYLGQLAALGRINPANYDGDPDLDGLISVVPFGLDDKPPVHVRDVLKGVVPGIEVADRVLLWSGGLYNWFDPQTLVRAVGVVHARRGGVRLFFQGTKHPHPGVPEMSIVGDTQMLAAELGLLGTAVFFNDSWVDYADRQNYLTEADAGVSTHHSHVETTFSFRTRILDYLWANLPMVVTDGDHFADLVRSEKLGIVVPAGDVDALANALERVLFDFEFAAEARANISRVREAYYWNVALKPLLEFVAAPHRSRDAAEISSTVLGSRLSQRRRRSGFRYDVGLVAHYLKNGGVSVVAQKVKRRLVRRPTGK